MLFQVLFEVLLLVGVLYFIWRMFLRPRAEKYVRAKENTRLQQKMELLRQKRANLDELQAERDVTKEFLELEAEEQNIQDELDRLEKDSRDVG